jgi:hypothetical protein
VEGAKKDMFVHLGLKRRASRCWIEVAAFWMNVGLYLMAGLRLIELALGILGMINLYLA